MGEQPPAAQKAGEDEEIGKPERIRESAHEIERRPAAEDDRAKVAKPLGVDELSTARTQRLTPSRPGRSRRAEPSMKLRVPRSPASGSTRWTRFRTGTP